MSQLELSVHLLSQQELTVYGIAVLFGLMIGSFVNVVVFRLPKGIPVEIDNGKWTAPEDLIAAMGKTPQDFSPSLHLIWQRFEAIVAQQTHRDL